MASVKISGLPEQAAAADTDVMAVAGVDGVAKKLSLSKLFEFFKKKNEDVYLDAFPAKTGTVANNEVIMELALTPGTWIVSAYAGVGVKILLKNSNNQVYRCGSPACVAVRLSADTVMSVYNNTGGDITAWADGANFYITALRIKA